LFDFLIWLPAVGLAARGILAFDPRAAFLLRPGVAAGFLGRLAGFA
jgi:hypothetical protein